MVLVVKSAIPVYLHVSELYQTLSDEEQDTFEVPDGNLRANDEVVTLEDARHLLSTLRYWGLLAVTNRLAEYLLKAEPPEIVQLVEEFGSQFAELRVIAKVGTKQGNEERFKAAVESGMVSVVQWVCKDCDVASLASADALGAYCILATQTEGTDCLRFLHEHGFVWNKLACTEAARHGNLACLQYLHEHGCGWDANCPTAAGWMGHLPCLKYAYEHGCPRNENVARGCAISGSAACLRYVLEKNEESGTFTYGVHGPCAMAASEGQLQCLIVAHEFGCFWNQWTCTFAASGGHIACLRYARENGCAWGVSTSAAAARANSIECLQYLHENGCPWDKDCTKAAARHSAYGCLKYAVEHGCPCDALVKVAYYRHCAGASLTLALGLS
jgi:hypothetical protein